MAGDLKKTEAWRLEKLAELGVSGELAAKAARARRATEGGYAVDVHYVEAWMATHPGATADQSVRIAWEI